MVNFLHIFGGIFCSVCSIFTPLIKLSNVSEHSLNDISGKKLVNLATFLAFFGALRKMYEFLEIFWRICRYFHFSQIHSYYIESLRGGATRGGATRGGRQGGATGGGITEA